MAKKPVLLNLEKGGKTLKFALMVDDDAPDRFGMELLDEIRRNPEKLNYVFDDWEPITQLNWRESSENEVFLVNPKDFDPIIADETNVKRPLDRVLASAKLNTIIKNTDMIDNGEFPFSYKINLDTKELAVEKKDKNSNEYIPLTGVGIAGNPLESGLSEARKILAFASRYKDYIDKKNGYKDFIPTFKLRDLAREALEEAKVDDPLTDPSDIFVRKVLKLTNGKPIGFSLADVSNYSYEITRSGSNLQLIRNYLKAFKELYVTSKAEGKPFLFNAIGSAFSAIEYAKKMWKNDKDVHVDSPKQAKVKDYLSIFVRSVIEGIKDVDNKLTRGFSTYTDSFNYNAKKKLSTEDKIFTAIHPGYATIRLIATPIYGVISGFIRGIKAVKQAMENKALYNIRNLNPDIEKKISLIADKRLNNNKTTEDQKQKKILVGPSL